MPFKRILSVAACLIVLSSCSYIPWFGQRDDNSDQAVELGPPDADRATDYSCRAEAGEGGWRCAVKGSPEDVPPVKNLYSGSESEKADAEIESAAELAMSTPQPVRHETDAAFEAAINSTPEEPIRVSPTAASRELSVVGLRLLELPDSYYAVQLMAAPYEEQAEIYVENRELDAPEIVPIATERGEWYVVILAYEPAFDSAQDRAEAFVVDYPGESPWVRKVSDLKEAHARRGSSAE